MLVPTWHKLFQVNIYIKIRTINSNMKINISKKYIEKENFNNNRILGYILYNKQNKPIYLQLLMLNF